MRKLILLTIIALVVLAIIYHDRLYVRDPLGKVERGGVAVAGARVFINYSNDILVQEDGGRRMFVVQHDTRLPGSPTGLTCIQGLLCVTPPDHTAPDSADSSHQAQMSDREVSFTDLSGDQVHVQIR